MWYSCPRTLYLFLCAMLNCSCILRFDVGSPRDVSPDVEQWVDQYMTFSSECKTAALFHLTLRFVPSLVKLMCASPGH